MSSAPDEPMAESKWSAKVLCGGEANDTDASDAFVDAGVSRVEEWAYPDGGVQCVSKRGSASARRVDPNGVGVKTHL